MNRRGFSLKSLREKDSECADQIARWLVHVVLAGNTRLYLGGDERFELAQVYVDLRVHGDTNDPPVRMDRSPKAPENPVSFSQWIASPNERFSDDEHYSTEEDPDFHHETEAPAIESSPSPEEQSSSGDLLVPPHHHNEVPLRVLLFGGPGQGKSTLLHWLQLTHAARLLWEGSFSSNDELKRLGFSHKQSESFSDRLLRIQTRIAELSNEETALQLPVRIELSRLLRAASKQTTRSAPEVLLKHIAGALGAFDLHPLTESSVARALDHGPLCWLFDGLDEVPVGKTRDRIEGWIKEISDQSAARASVFVSTRPQGFDRQCLGDFLRLSLSKLDRYEVSVLLDRTLRTMHPSSPEQRSQTLEVLDKARQRSGLSELLSTPLYATMLLWIVEQTGSAPLNRWTLFESFYEAIYDRESRKGFQELLQRFKPEINALHERAALLLQGGTGLSGALITRERLLSLLQQLLLERVPNEGRRRELVEQAMRAIEQRLVLLVRTEEAGLSFDVRSVQEFFAARALSDPTAPPELRTRRLRAIAADTSWQNVLLFTVARAAATSDTVWLDSLVQVCTELNSGVPEEDPARIGGKAGSRLAAWVLLDDAIFDQINTARRLSECVFDVPIRVANELLRRFRAAEAAHQIEFIKPLLNRTSIEDHELRWAMAVAGESEEAREWWRGMLKVLPREELRGAFRSQGTWQNDQFLWLETELKQEIPDLWIEFFTQNRPLVISWHDRIAIAWVGTELFRPKVFSTDNENNRYIAAAQSLARVAGLSEDYFLVAYWIWKASPNTNALKELVQASSKRRSEASANALPFDADWLAKLAIHRAVARGASVVCGEIDGGQLGDPALWRAIDDKASVRSLEAAVARWIASDGLPSQDAEWLPLTGISAILGEFVAIEQQTVLRILEDCAQPLPKDVADGLRNILSVFSLPRGSVPQTRSKRISLWPRVARFLPGSMQAILPQAPTDIDREEWECIAESAEVARENNHESHPNISNDAKWLRDLGVQHKAWSRTKFWDLLLECASHTPAVLSTPIPSELGVTGDSDFFPVNRLFTEAVPPEERKHFLARVRKLTPQIARLAGGSWRHYSIPNALLFHALAQGAAPSDARILCEFLYDAWSIACRGTALRRKAELVSLGLLSSVTETPTTTATTAMQTEAFRISKVTLSSIRSIKQMELSFEPPSDRDKGQLIVLLGDNSVGKTSVLRAIALALSDPKLAARQTLKHSLVRRGASSATCLVTAHSTFSAEITDDDDSMDIRVEKNEDRPFVVAYGASRGSAFGSARTGDVGKGKELHTLFEEQSSLVGAEEWLLRISSTHPGAYEAARNALRSLLEHMKITEMRLAGDKRGVLLSGDSVGSEMPLDALSDGFANVIGWAVDTMAHWINKRANTDELLPKDFVKFMTGVVLIDEVDLHLHPTWQQSVLETIQRVFQRMTFIVTTHNPVTVLNAPKGTEVWKLERCSSQEDAQLPKVTARKLPIPEGISVEQVLIGPWFALSSTVDPTTREKLERLIRLTEGAAEQHNGERSELQEELHKSLGFDVSRWEDQVALAEAAAWRQSQRDAAMHDPEALRKYLQQRLAERHNEREE